MNGLEKLDRFVKLGNVPKISGENPVDVLFKFRHLSCIVPC